MIQDEWEKAKWIFKQDGALRDIYVNDVNLDGWVKLVEFLNSNYLVNFSTSGKTLTKHHHPINPEEIIQLLTDETGDLECKTASIYLGEIMINCHFSNLDLTEFDIEPGSIETKNDFKVLLGFMSSLSKTLNSEVMLTQENSPGEPLISIDSQTPEVVIYPKTSI